MNNLKITNFYDINDTIKRKLSNNILKKYKYIKKLNAS